MEVNQEASETNRSASPTSQPPAARPRSVLWVTSVIILLVAGVALLAVKLEQPEVVCGSAAQFNEEGTPRLAYFKGVEECRYWATHLRVMSPTKRPDHDEVYADLMLGAAIRVWIENSNSDDPEDKALAQTAAGTLRDLVYQPAADAIDEKVKRAQQWAALRELGPKVLGTLFVLFAFALLVKWRDNKRQIYTQPER